MDPKNPTISVVIATFQSGKTIERCLQSIRDQKYPQELIHILIADGGSTDKTLETVKKYDAKVITVPPDKQSAEYNKGVAVRQATRDLLLMIDHDNVLPHPHWLANMVRPFQENETMVAVQPLRYAYDPTLSLLDRYCALFGASDPVVYYLGKADHLPWFKHNHITFGKVTDKESYYLVTIDSERIPTLGANGCLIRRDLLFQHAQISEDLFFHIDVHVDLITQGFNTYAFTKDTIIHLTSYKKLRSFLYRRKLFIEQFYVKTKAQRRYHMYRGQADFWRLFLFIVAAATVIWPTIEALRGYLTIRDKAWFLHPVLAFCLLWIYGFTFTKQFIRGVVY